MPTKSSGIPISLPHGSSLLEFFPGTLLLMRLGLLRTLKASTWHGRSFPTVFPISKVLGSRCITAVEPRHPQRKMKHCALYKEEEREWDSDDEVECDLSNMEITEQLRQYFAQTERHREKRRRQQQLDAERLNDYVNADHGLDFNHRRSVEPPSEKPWARRQAEMKLLYGNSVPKILAVEAAVQLGFDKLCDRK